MGILPAEKSASEVLKADKVRSLMNNNGKKIGGASELKPWETFTLVRARKSEG